MRTWVAVFAFLSLAGSQAQAQAPACSVSGTVIESTPEQLVLEWQNERIRFTHSHGSVESMLGVSAGDRVTVEFSPATDNAGVIIEIKRAPGEAPGEVPEDKGIIDDRGFYSAELSDAHASRFLA